MNYIINMIYACIFLDQYDTYFMVNTYPNSDASSLCVLYDEEIYKYLLWFWFSGKGKRM